MAGDQDKVYFEEDAGFYRKKKLRKLALGLFLLIIPPPALYFMFWGLIRWSSLFPQETGMILIFLLLTPWAGVFFILKAVMMPRMRIYKTWIPSPVLLSKRRIPLRDIKYVEERFSSEDGPRTVTLYMKKSSNSTRDSSPKLGEFLESDTGGMMKAFQDRGIKTKLG